MSKEMMLDEVIRVRGFEDQWTIWFAELMENESLSLDALLDAMAVALAMPFFDEE